jgi:uncharacterized delta-60 repeat protein
LPPHFIVLRYNPNGTLDSSFGTGGIVVTDFNGRSNSTDIATCLALQADGKIVVGGSANQSTVLTGMKNFAVARYLTNGLLDSTFAANGKTTVDFSFGNDEARGVAVLSDGRIVLAGSADCCNGGQPAVAIARLNPDGTADASFGPGADGQAHLLFAPGMACSANAVALDGDGRLVLAGSAVTSPPADFAVARILMGEYPFFGSPLQVPGTIQAEDYDNGGQGLGYADTSSTVNEPIFGWRSNYRPGSGVDLETYGSNGVQVTYIYAGEWLQYSIHVTVPAPYRVLCRVASVGSGGWFHLEVDGVNVSGPIEIPYTGSWLSWQDIIATGVNLPAGNHLMRVVFDTNGTHGDVGTLDYLQFIPDVSPRLAMSRSNNDITISWPAWALGFNLQASEDLRAWTSVTQPVIQVGDRFSVNVPITGASKFFRLTR